MRSSSVWARRSRRLRLFVALASPSPGARRSGQTSSIACSPRSRDGSITLSDVRIVKTLGLVAVPAGADADKTILKALIDRLLVLEEVERYAPPEPEDAAIEQRVAAVQARFASRRRLRTGAGAPRHECRLRHAVGAATNLPDRQLSRSTICRRCRAERRRASRTTGGSTLTNSRGAGSRWMKWSC